MLQIDVEVEVDVNGERGARMSDVEVVSDAEVGRNVGQPAEKLAQPAKKVADVAKDIDNVSEAVKIVSEEVAATLEEVGIQNFKIKEVITPDCDLAVA